MTEKQTHQTTPTTGVAADPAVVAKPKRRTFSNTYKLRILEEAEQCTEPGQIGALLRREGLYSSHLTDWRRQRRQGRLNGHQQQAQPQDSAQLLALRAENERLQGQLAQAELLISAQKKLSQALQAIMTPGSER